MDIQAIYEKRKDNPVYNTSYPLSPADWARYRSDTPLSFADEKNLSFYIHIPFCKHLCSFCEYTRMKCPGTEMQLKYVSTIGNDIQAFIRSHPDITLLGFDIGGGTPTALSEAAFLQLMTIFKHTVSVLQLHNDFEPSIEATFDTISATKARQAREAGIKRISLGVQSADQDVLRKNHRHNANTKKMKDVICMLHSEGIEKVNLDMMYGLRGQTVETLNTDLQLIGELQPEQVTVYELRTNMIHENCHMNKNELYQAYSLIYNGLTSMGYRSRWGSNTFSLNEDDYGVSSYLRYRMLHGAAYKGFGIAAQSMCREGVAYNVGKSHSNIKELLDRESFSEEFTYRLPPGELASKYIAIGAYNGSFSIERICGIMGQGAPKHYEEQVNFCLNNGLMKREESDNRRLVITHKGFKNYGAVFSLFYCPQ